MMIGFSEGYLVVISTHMKEIGEELFSGWFHKVQWQTHTRASHLVPPASPQTHHRPLPPKHLQDRLDDIAFSPIMQRAATAGTNHIKMVDMTDWKEVKEEATSIDRAHGPIDKLAWTSDGQILTASTRTGVLYNFLARMPTIHDTHDTRVAYLSSLREISVVDCVGDARLISLPVSIEPSFVALGPFHVAVGMNNRVWFYRSDGNSRDLVNEREYLSTVDVVRLSRDYAAVLCQGRVHLHLIETMNAAERETLVSQVCCCCVSLFSTL